MRSRRCVVLFSFLLSLFVFSCSAEEEGTTNDGGLAGDKASDTTLPNERNDGTTSVTSSTAKTGNNENIITKGEEPSRTAMDPHVSARMKNKELFFNEYSEDAADFSLIESLLGGLKFMDVFFDDLDNDDYTDIGDVYESDKNQREGLDEAISDSLSTSFPDLFPTFAPAAVSAISDYVSDLFDFTKFPNFFDTLFAPLVGMFYSVNGMQSRITTTVDFTQKICKVKVDMTGLPSTSITEVEVESDGALNVYFSNGQLMSMTGKPESGSHIRGKTHDSEIPDKHLADSQKSALNDESDNPTKSSSVIVSTPNIVSTVWSSSTFYLDERCDASSEQAKAVAKDEVLELKFPLKECAINDNKNGNKCLLQLKNKSFKNNNRMPQNREPISDTASNTEDPPLPKTIADPLYLNQPEKAKKKHSIPLVKLEEF